ncbi:MFS transporter [Streptomyces sp. NEAU-YJ-81]|uniref:MFS transporter n=1 Tax=Streptomyces sp. NEAU-YJ-81 TaxID=2820288 RepID=UPI001ABD1971|nr:MFS transporter [Streptomyces sp. NEAU-YJ-81]MBO3677511.1 MFS transporter [Streptomyces sp. NEAU-YJ-81]
MRAQRPDARSGGTQRRYDGLPVDAPPSAKRPWRLLIVLLAAQFIANVDTAIANIAAPSIQTDLHASGGETGLVVSGYVATYAVLLVIGARLGATHGHRRIFLLGMAVFTATSLACALAPGPGLLIAARIAQGAGAALMVPQVLSGIQLHFAGEQRLRALGYYAIALSGGAVAGQTLGGVLIAADIHGTSWRPIFLINVPAGLLILAAAMRFMPGDAKGRHTRPLDLNLRGMLTLSAAVTLLIVPLLLGAERGWPTWTWVCLAASVPVLVVFHLGQRRLAASGGRPLIAEEVIREPAVRWSLLAHGVTTMTYFALLFVLANYLQDGLGRGPAYAGLAMVSWVAAFGLAGPLLARLPERNRQATPLAGCVILAVSYFSVGNYLLTGHSTGPMLFVLLAVGGLGLGISSNALIGRMTFALPNRYAADLSGVISTNAQLCGALGVAALGTSYLRLAESASAGQSAKAFEVVLFVCAGLALLGAVAAHQGSRARPPGDRTPIDT